MSRPFSAAAYRYWDAGWHGVFPLPYRQKSPPPDGRTGYSGTDLTRTDVYSYIETHAAGNIGIRMPEGVLGIDVDAYDGKPGEKTLAALEAECGPLPAGPISTSRDDGVSGIRFFRVPIGVPFTTKLPGIEFLQRHHRYAVVWPSIHPDDRLYRWLDSNGAEMTGPPDVASLPDLPAAYVARLRLDLDGRTLGPGPQVGSAAVSAVRASVHPGAPCRAVTVALRAASDGARGVGGTSRHDGMVAGVLALVRLAEQGHRGGAEALDELRVVFVAAVADDRPHESPEVEFERAEYGAWSKVAGRPTPDADRRCCGLTADEIAARETDLLAITGGVLSVSPPDTRSGAPVGAPDNRDPVDSWSRVDLSDVLDGDYVPVVPTLIARSDGRCLFYPGLVHWVYGESESGKSWVALHAACIVLASGGSVLYVDYESDRGSIVGRLLALGADRAAIRERFDYRHPDDSVRDSAGFRDLLAQRFDLAVLDGVTEALGIEGFSTIDNDEITEWGRLVPRRIARMTGAATLCVDHLSKSSDGSSSGHPIGAQAKKAIIDGAAYVVEPKTALGQGLLGKVELRVAKDRPGGVRPISSPKRRGDRTQHTATMVLDSRVKPIAVTIEPWNVGGETTAEGEPRSDQWRPTGFMQSISILLEASPDGMTGKAIRQSLTGRATTIGQALLVLVEEGYVTRIERTDSNATAFVHRSVRPFRELTSD